MDVENVGSNPTGRTIMCNCDKLENLVYGWMMIKKARGSITYVDWLLLTSPLVLWDSKIRSRKAETHWSFELRCCGFYDEGWSTLHGHLADHGLNSETANFPSIRTAVIYRMYWANLCTVTTLNDWGYLWMANPNTIMAQIAREYGQEIRS